MYNKDKTTLIYHSDSVKDFYVKFGISHILTTTKVLPTSIFDMSVSEITAMLNKDKEGLNIILGNAKKVGLLDVKTNQTLNFKSLTACAEYFRNLGFKTTGNTGLVLRPEVSTTVILLLGG